MERMRFKVDLTALFREIASHTEVRGSPRAIMGLESVQEYLYTIAQRALETGNGVAIAELEVMAVLRPITKETREEA